MVKLYKDITLKQYVAEKGGHLEYTEILEKIRPVIQSL